MENKRYQAIVNNLLPAGSPGVDSKLRVVVSAHADIPLPPPEVPALTDHAVGWLSANWPTLAMIGVGMISLLVLRSMVRAGPSSTDQSSSALPLVSQPRTHDDDDDEEQDDLPGHRLRFQSSGRSLREELVELIREDPDSAANVLRNWIGEAA